MWHVKGTGVVHVACKGDRSGTCGMQRGQEWCMWHVKGTGVVHVACKGDRSGTCGM